MIKPIPKKTLRKKIYKEALELIENSKPEDIRWKSEVLGIGLCLMLPALWIGGDNISDISDQFIHPKTGVEFGYRNSVYLFPEFGQYYPSTYPNDQTREDLIQWRIETLKKIINEM